MQPHKGASIGFQPRIRKGAFFNAAWRYGCRSFSVYNRTYISSTFSSAVEEYWHVIEHVGLWPAMGERQVEITGPDAGRFVQFLTPRDMSKCAVGQCKYALLTAPDGGVVCDPIILRPDENRYWLSTSDCDLELWSKGVAVNGGFDVSIRDAGVTVMQVQGPKSVALLADLFGEAIVDLKNYWSMPAVFEGNELQVSRTGWSGEFGYEIYLQNASQGDRLFDALMETGARYRAAPGCVNQIRRIESGILSWGLDVTMDETPFEVGLGRLVDLDSGADFIGKAALKRLKAQPLNKKLVGLVVSGPALDGNEDVWPLRRAGIAVGRLTSLCYSPRLEKNIALGIVDAGNFDAGCVLDVETWDGGREVTVCELPFMPKKQSLDAHELRAAIKT